jgi:hypothetical protein
VVTDEDVALLEQGISIKIIRKQLVARLMREAFEQGGILSTRDVALILATRNATVSLNRTEYEKENQTAPVRDFNRVKILMEDNKDIEFIHLATNIAKPVIKQYQAIFN